MATGQHHFQKWAVEEVDGFVTTKRTADGGIDGRLYFGVPDEREEAQTAGLIVMQPLGDVKLRNFRKLMADARDLEVKDAARPYPRMQILSVPEILNGKQLDTPKVFGKSSHPQDEMRL